MAMFHPSLPDWTVQKPPQAENQQVVVFIPPKENENLNSKHFFLLL